MPFFFSPSKDMGSESKIVGQKKKKKNKFWITIDSGVSNMQGKLKYVKCEGKKMSSEMKEIPNLVI